jgi:hypothetical protein
LNGQKYNNSPFNLLKIYGKTDEINVSIGKFDKVEARDIAKKYDKECLIWVYSQIYES